MEIAANERSENKIIVNYYRLILFTGSEVGYMILGGRGGGRGAVTFSLPSTPQQLGFSCWGGEQAWSGAAPLWFQGAVGGILNHRECVGAAVFVHA